MEMQFFLRGSSKMGWDLFGYYVFLEGPVTVEKAGTLDAFELLGCALLKFTP